MGVAVISSSNAVDGGRAQPLAASTATSAAQANRRAENIGARRLHTVMEALLEDLSFDAPERTDRKVVIDAEDVRRTLGPILADEDLARFIL